MPIVSKGAILAPAAVLVLWTLVMLGWTFALRLPAITRSGAMAKAPPGLRGQDLEKILPPPTNWPAHNYAHLVEQPTLFYATVVVLALVGAGPIDVALAWTYVAVRVVHSIWQATINKIPARFALFVLSSLVLIALAVRAAIACFSQAG